ncbi:MAG: MBL fold metallo-hydrolase [Pseudomonadota bacterium]
MFTSSEMRALRLSFASPGVTWGLSVLVITALCGSLWGCGGATASTADRPVLSTTPFLMVLGVAQDAGYPQAGCNRAHCERGWANRDEERAPASLGAVDPIERQALLFDATPALPRQWRRLQTAVPAPLPELSGVFLTHAHIGHYTGLMYFGREAMGARDVPVYAMPRMQTFLLNNGPWSQLVALQNIRLRPLAANHAVHIGRLAVVPFVVPHRDEFSETVGYRISGPNRSALFIPDIDKWSRWDVDLASAVRGADYAFIDATFFDSDELPGRNMADIPHPLVVETMFELKPLTRAERERVYFIHMNHTNPLLDPSSPQSASVTARGFRIAHEGLRVPL